MSILPRASVVVPTYNQRFLLEPLLEALARQVFDASFEVVIADDASTDDTEAFLASWLDADLPYARQYVRLPTNGGPGRARNAGARAARGGIIAFTDSDCRPHPDWLAHLVHGLEPEAQIAGAGGRVLPTQEDVFSHYLTFLRVLEPPDHVPYLVTCNAAYLREAFLDAGGFPEDIGVPGGEDIEISIRLWKRGWRFRFVPDAVVMHAHRDTLRSFARTWRNYGYGTGRVLRRSLSEAEREGQPTGAPNDWPGHYLRPTLQVERATAIYRECRRRGFGWKHRVKALILWAVERGMYWYGWRLGSREG